MTMSSCLFTRIAISTVSGKQNYEKWKRLLTPGARELHIHNLHRFFSDSS